MTPHGNVPAFKLGPTLGTHWHPGFKSRARGWRHNWNCRQFCLNGEKRRAAFRLDFPPRFGSLSYLLSPNYRNPSLTCAAQLMGIGGSRFLSRKCASSSVFIFAWPKLAMLSGTTIVRYIECAWLGARTPSIKMWTKYCNGIYVYSRRHSWWQFKVSKWNVH